MRIAENPAIIKNGIADYQVTKEVVGIEKSKKMEREEVKFLSFCSSEDKDRLLGNNPMTVRDFERLSYLVWVMGFTDYHIYLHVVFAAQVKVLEEERKRRDMIAEEYPRYYEEEGIMERYGIWVEEFCNRLPTERLRKKYRKSLD